MTIANPSLRILGVTVERVANFRSQPNGKSTGLYAALDRRYEVVGTIRPELLKLERYCVKLRYFHRDRDRWQQHAALNPWMFKRRTLSVQHQLEPLRDAYDLIVLLHAMHAPGLYPHARPYVITTDNTYLLSERYYRPWAPLSGRERNERLRLERDTLQRAAFLFPRSEWLRHSMIDDYGCDPARVIRVGGGSNIHVGSLEGKRYDTQTAIFVGEGFERKGGTTLLQAWELVRRRLPEAQLWIVGPQPRQSTLPGVRWFGHVADRNRLSELYAQSSVFVLPSIFEPWGHVFFEAMGHGLPCIGSDCCAMPEIITQGTTGLLAPPAEPEPLADALVTLLGDPHLAERMGRRAYADVVENHTWDHVVDRMAPYIEQFGPRGVDLPWVSRLAASQGLPHEASTEGLPYKV